MELSEEEKEAIETIEFLKKKKWYKYGGDSGTEILDEDEKKDVDIILNLIDKRQKEIEEKNCLIDVLQHKIEELLDNKKEINYIKPIDIKVQNYISKDKIRELIEKYEQDYKRQDKEELFNLTKITAGKLSALNELLEE